MGHDRPPFKRVRERDLDSLAEYALEVCAFRGIVAPKPFTVLHVASVVLLGAIMGDNWLAEIQGDPCSYLHPPARPVNLVKLCQWWGKIHHLTDTLFALHDVENISDRLERLKAPALESTVAELSVVELLRYASPVWLRPESKGGYDVDLMLDDNVMSALEIKCRLEATEHSHSGILSRLKKARKQLPGDRPSIIWVRYSRGAWGPSRSKSDFAKTYATIDGAAREFLRNTQTVSALVFSYEEAIFDLFPPEERVPFMVGWGVRRYMNERARPPDSVGRLLDKFERFAVRDGVLAAPVLTACTKAACLRVACPEHGTQLKAVHHKQMPKTTLVRLTYEPAPCCTKHEEVLQEAVSSMLGEENLWEGEAKDRLDLTRFEVGPLKMYYRTSKGGTYANRLDTHLI